MNELLINVMNFVEIIIVENQIQIWFSMVDIDVVAVAVVVDDDDG